MKVAAAKWQMVVFSGVLHAYTDQGADVPGIAAWDEPATRQSYTLTINSWRMPSPHDCELPAEC